VDDSRDAGAVGVAVISEDRLVVTSGTECVVLDRRTLERKRRDELPAGAATRPVGWERLFVGLADGSLVTWDAARDSPDNRFQRVPLSRSRITGLSPDAAFQTVYAIDADGRVFHVDGTGRVLSVWTASAPAVVPPILLGDRAFIATVDGSLEELASLTKETGT
jgi:hypothetical protein